ncbi:hypothetical protein AFLA_010446 [Aspergillus flavus NRRL3357]|nr:hypothetical protein AFLA_010446 [Aspergillus flavus NRRL3357]
MQGETVARPYSNTYRCDGVMYEGSMHQTGMDPPARCTILYGLLCHAAEKLKTSGEPLPILTNVTVRSYG